MPSSRKATVGKVYLSRDGNYGTEADFLVPIFAETGFGGTRMDHAELLVDLGLHTSRGDATRDGNKHVINHEVFDEAAGGANIADGLIGKYCEIELERPDGWKHVVHFGQISLKSIDIDDKERLTVTSRLSKFVFGDVVKYMKVENPPLTGEVGVFKQSYIQEPIVFNPMVQGTCVGNMNTVAKGSRFYPYNLFVDPGSLRTENARRIQNASHLLVPGSPGYDDEGGVGWWTLGDAVKYLCGECNELQSRILNPDPAELKKLTTILRNYTVPPGTYLPEALDQLLQAHGYRWYVRYSGRGRDGRRITIAKAGEERNPQNVYLQMPGNKLRREYSNAAHIEVRGDHAAAINRVVVYGGFTQVEGTWLLRAGWNRDYDEIDEDKFYKDAEDWADRPQHHDVFRKWVLDEAGDYDDAQFGVPTPADLTTAFRQTFPNYPGVHPPVTLRRRRFLPMLTTKQNAQLNSRGRPEPYGATGGCHVQWWNHLHDNGDGKVPGAWEDLWTDMDGFGCELLEDECGIRFTDNNIPWEIRDCFLEAKSRYLPEASMRLVRVTATIQSDSRIRYDTADVRNFRDAPGIAAFGVAPNQEQTLVINKEQSFHLRKRVGVGPYVSAFLGTMPADEVDSSTQIRDFAVDILEASNRGEITGPITIEGLDPVTPDGQSFAYEIGNSLKRVVGREISLSASGGIAVKKHYPQIANLRYVIQGNQHTIITLETLRTKEAHLGALIS